MLVSGGRLVSALMALFAIRAVTTFLTPEQYGELALLITVQMFCGLFLVNPVGQHINLHTHAWWDDGTLVARLKSYRGYVLMVSLVGLLVAIFLGEQHTFHKLMLTAAVMFSMIMAATWNATLIPMLNMLGFRAASALLGILTVSIGLASSILLVMWLPSATAWLAGQVIGMGVGALGAKYALQLHTKNSRFDVHCLPLLDKQTFIKYCLPLALATGLMWLQLSGYRFLIEGYWGLAQLGFLVIGLQLAGQIWALVETIAAQFLYPLFYRRVSSYENRKVIELAFSDLINTLVPVYFVLTGFIILSASNLLKLLVAVQFQGAINFVMLGAGIEMFRVIGNVLSNAAHVRRQTKSLTLPCAVGAIVSLALIFFAGTRQMDISWAGEALLVGAGAMLMTMALGMYRQVRFSLDLMRFSVGMTVMLIMLVLAFSIRELPEVRESVAILMLSGGLAGVIVVALLWKNPAALRLLNVQLQKK